MIPTDNIPVDWSGPVNWNSHLNRSLAGWWLAIPPRNRGVKWVDLVKARPGTLTSMDPGTDWVSTNVRRGGWGWLDFDGSNDYVSVAASPALPSAGQMTAMCWYVGLSSIAANEVILARTGGASNYGFGCVRRNTGPFGFFWGNAAAPNGATTPTVGTAYHVAWVRSGSTGSWSSAIYVNGKLDGSGSGIATNPDSGSYALTIGGRDSGLQPNDCRLDDIRLFNRALSATEIYDIFRDSMSGHKSTLSWMHPPYITGASAAGGAGPIFGGRAIGKGRIFGGSAFAC